jgi:hypothetical protein
VIPDLVCSRRGYEWSQSLQKFMPLHHDMGRAVSPACLESIGESSVRHRLESVERDRRSGHITTQTFESIPIVGRNGHIGV